MTTARWTRAIPILPVLDDGQQDKPWGFRQFGVNDPDMNLIMFAQEL